jgi:hypothetical protein
MLEANRRQSSIRRMSGYGTPLAQGGRYASFRQRA